MSDPDLDAARRRWEARTARDGSGIAPGRSRAPRAAQGPRAVPAREPVEPVESTLPDGRRRAVVVLPWDRAPLTLNARLAWRAMYEARKGVAEAAGWVLRGVHPFDGPVEVEIVRYLGRAGIADADNLSATMKPCLDALVAARVLPADDAATVVRTSQRVVPAAHDPFGPAQPRLLLVITEARPNEFEHYGTMGEGIAWA